MKTYQDLMAAGQDERARMAFIKVAINEHKTSAAYKVAADAEKYYAKKNVTIEKFQKFVYNVNGTVGKDIFSASYKLKTSFFRRFVLQQVQYVLSNGVTFEDDKTKAALGTDFDNQMQKLAKKAMVDGVSFGFWNMDHLEVFCFADTSKDPGFAPIYDENTGALMAGVRYWKTANTMRATLYEVDGYTECVADEDGEMKAMTQKQTYKRNIVSSGANGVRIESGGNYHGFPIIPMYANDLHESEIIGIRESIDCYDFIKSGLANDIDDTSGFYWILKNTGGMDDSDLQKFIDRMKIVRATAVDDDVQAEAHTLDIPTDARAKMLEILKEDLYDDFQIVNVRDLSSGAKTATEIRAAYQPMDDKCGDFEYCIRDFVYALLALNGIKDEPAFKWNRIANQTEETQMVLSAAAELGTELTLKKLPFLTPEEVAGRMKEIASEDINRFGAQSKTDGNVEE